MTAVSPRRIWTGSLIVATPCLRRRSISCSLWIRGPRLRTVSPSSRASSTMSTARSTPKQNPYSSASKTCIVCRSCSIFLILFPLEQVITQPKFYQMPLTNETSPLSCRFLTATEFKSIHKTFVSAFSDYVVKFELTERQFQNHVTLNAVDLEKSVGCTVGGELAGVSLNGFGVWEGRRTVYDAGTGVLPRFRRRGVSRAMFEWMIPMFTGEGYQQVLLEVIRRNEPAVKLYEQLGFRTTRELLLLESERPVTMDHPISDDIEIREIHRHESIPFTLFWDGRPSWQNSVEAVERSLKVKRLFGAFE